MARSSSNSRFTGSTNRMDTFTPTIARRRVDIKRIVCPECGAEVGEPCYASSAGSHAARKRMATRLDNQRRFG